MQNSFLLDCSLSDALLVCENYTFNPDNNIHCQYYLYYIIIYTAYLLTLILFFSLGIFNNYSIYVIYALNVVVLLYIVGVYSWDKIISISYNFYQTTYYSYKYEYKKSKF